MSIASKGWFQIVYRRKKSPSNHRFLEQERRASRPSWSQFEISSPDRFLAAPGVFAARQTELKRNKSERLLFAEAGSRSHCVRGPASRERTGWLLGKPIRSGESGRKGQEPARGQRFGLFRRAPPPLSTPWSKTRDANGISRSACRGRSVKKPLVKLF